MVAPGAGCPGVRFASVLRTAPVGRALPIPCAFQQLLSDAPATNRQRVRQHLKKAPPAPTNAHRPRRPRLRFWATEPAVRSLSPVGRSIAHYGPYAPPLRPVPRSARAPTPDTVKLQYPRQRGVPLPEGQPAAPTANPHPGPPHSASSGRTALRAFACQQPVAPFGRPLAALARRQPTAPAQVANAQGRRFPKVSISHARPPSRAPRTTQKPTRVTSDSAEAKPGRGRMLRRLPQRQQRPLAELGALRARVQRGVPRTPEICSVSLCIASGSAAVLGCYSLIRCPPGVWCGYARRGPHGRPPSPLAKGI